MRAIKRSLRMLSFLEIYLLEEQSIFSYSLLDEGYQYRSSSEILRMKRRSKELNAGKKIRAPRLDKVYR
jgi:hypothetical protein